MAAYGPGSRPKRSRKAASKRRSSGVEPGSGALDMNTARRRAAGLSRPATPARVSASGRITGARGCSRASPSATPAAFSGSSPA